MSGKLIVFGYKEHGKDFACEYLRDHHGLSFSSSSEFACHLFLYDQIKDQFGYQSPEECFADRRNHRQLWYEAIRDYNTPDKARLGRKIFENNTVYCGIRDDQEFEALKNGGFFDLAIWIDASGRLPPEDLSSMKLSSKHADIIVDNNTTKEDLYERLDGLVSQLEGMLPTRTHLPNTSRSSREHCA